VSIPQQAATHEERDTAAFLKAVGEALVRALVSNSTSKSSPRKLLSLQSAMLDQSRNPLLMTVSALTPNHDDSRDTLSSREEAIRTAVASAMAGTGPPHCLRLTPIEKGPFPSKTMTPPPVRLGPRPDVQNMRPHVLERLREEMKKAEEHVGRDPFHIM
jgi:hypothetical protein